MSTFMGVRERMKELGFVVLSSGLYQLYIADIPPRTSLIVEGERSARNGKLYFDVYLLTKDYRSKATKINVVYGHKVPIVQMVRIATKQSKFWKEKIKVNT